MSGLGSLTIIVGPNASGKTNAIEAIQLLTALTSFRTSLSKDLIMQGQDRAQARMGITDGKRDLEVALLVEEGKRVYSLNGKARKTKDLRGTLPAVVFTPDDLNLVKGSDRFRRREVDVLGSQLNGNYHQIVHDFEKVLSQKNKLLKDGAPKELIYAVNEVYIKVASHLENYRVALFNRILPKIARHYSGISLSREKLEGEYRRSWDGRQMTFDESVEKILPDEIQRRRTLVGPHLDKISFYIDGLDSRAFSSQGQSRSIVLAIKLAEAEVIEEMIGQLPVLLLDDVMSELDESRRKALVEKLLAGKQTFITTANIDYFDGHLIEQAKIVELG